MSVTIALAGNPNSGKSTLFNLLTGSNQYVGNWPGVTVEKKEGIYKKNKEIKITDLPGIYSLSPYTLEEVVSRDYLLEENPDVIIDVIDASNIERNLYLATQLSELGIPMILALNMMDIVRKNGDIIDTVALKEKLNCEIVEISALKKLNIDKLMETAEKVAHSKNAVKTLSEFNPEVEGYIRKIEDGVQSLRGNKNSRWYAIKLFENDPKIGNKINVTPEENLLIKSVQAEAEASLDDDGEGIITDARYEFVTSITSDTVKKGRTGMSISDKIDRVVTNRFLAIPIFAAVMYLVYYIVVGIVSTSVTDWTNDVLIGQYIQENAVNAMEAWGVAPWLVSLVGDGIIGGVGAVLGFLPLIVTLYVILAILEDIGYMSRVAFILDRVFRKFGLSGKSFIPILVGTGCSVPGIVATRTIENDNDRRMTMIVNSFIPCGAKTEIIALFGASVFADKIWFAPLCYFAGIGAVILSGIILKKTSLFSGDPAPFVMELPEYHVPSIRNVARSTFDRSKAFVIKAGTIILLASIVVWFLQNISVDFQFHSYDKDSVDSLLAAIGKVIAPVLHPLGFGNWIAAVASFLGLVAKELVVGTMGVLSGFGEFGADDPNAIHLATHMFTVVSGLSFMLFNQLNIPCFAAVGAIRDEMQDKKWTLFALGYQTLFAYTISFMVYQFGMVFVEGHGFNGWTAGAVVVLLAYIYLLFRKPKAVKNNSISAVSASEK